MTRRAEKLFSQPVPLPHRRRKKRFRLRPTFRQDLLQPAIVNRFSYYGVANQIMNQQKSLLQSLLSARRFQLLMDAEVIDAKQAYSAMQFLTDVQNGVWSEVVAQAQTSAPEPVVDVCRRNLQRAYLEHLKNELNPKDAPTTILRPILPDDDGLFSGSNRGTDFRAVARAALRTLATQLDAAIPRAQDVMTRVHLQDCRREVELILNPKN